MNQLRTHLRTGFALLACGMGGLLVSTSSGQRDEGDRRRGFDPTEILKRIDANGNGTIEPNELSDRSRGFVGDLAKRANLDASQPIPVDKLIGAAEQQRKERESGGSSSGSTSGSSSGSQPGSSSNSSNSSNDRDRDRDRDRSDSDRDRDREREREREKAANAKPMTPTVLGFGTEDKTPKASGFDVPLSVDTTIPLEKRYDARVLEYVDRMLREQDKNKDGYIDNVEWKEGRWSTPPEESDTNKDNRLSKMELCERIARRFGLTNPPGATSSSTPGGSPASGSSSAATSGDAAKFRQYADSLLRQFDRNKNGVLEKDEWSEMKSEHRSADANADSVITIDELAAKLQAYSTSTASSSSSSKSSSGSSDRKNWWSKSSSTTKPGEKKDYRFQTSAERLPKGLPDWFLRSDADADGQIAMVEYATTWTDSTAAEFQKYDLDGDGFITPGECLASVAPKK